MGREATRNMVVIPNACPKALEFNDFNQYFQNDGGTVSPPKLCFRYLELGTLADLRLVELLAVMGKA